MTSTIIGTAEKTQHKNWVQRHVHNAALMALVNRKPYVAANIMVRSQPPIGADERQDIVAEALRITPRYQKGEPTALLRLSERMNAAELLGMAIDEHLVDMRDLGATITRAYKSAVEAGRFGAAKDMERIADMYRVGGAGFREVDRTLFSDRLGKRDMQTEDARILKWTLRQLTKIEPAASVKRLITEFEWRLHRHDTAAAGILYKHFIEYQGEFKAAAMNHAASELNRGYKDSARNDVIKFSLGPTDMQWLRKVSTVGGKADTEESLKILFTMAQGSTPANVTDSI